MRTAAAVLLTLILGVVFGLFLSVIYGYASEPEYESDEFECIELEDCPFFEEKPISNAKVILT